MGSTVKKQLKGHYPTSNMRKKETLRQRLNTVTRNAQGNTPERRFPPKTKPS